MATCLVLSILRIKENACQPENTLLMAVATYTSLPGVAANVPQLELKIFLRTKYRKAS
jgi:hypothetical protein